MATPLKNYKKEVWLPIKGYENLYKISSLGKVKSLDHKIIQKNFYKEVEHPYKGKILAIRMPKNKYPYVHLSKNGKITTKKIHRLVAENFILNPLNKKEVNHIDGNKLNNKVNNLEWCTSSENKKHAFSTGLRLNEFGEKSHNFKGKIQVLDKENNIIKILCGDREIKAFGLTSCGVHAVLTGRYKTHRSYYFRRIK
jgi:hypothetical protein